MPVFWHRKRSGQLLFEPTEQAMVTIKEIARAVGVSTATVSRVLNYDTTLSISPPKRKAIIETAEALNYATPRNRNRAATPVQPFGANVLPGTVRLALVHSLNAAEELADPYYVGVRLGIENRCQALKIEVVRVYHTESLPDATLLQNASGVIAVGKHYDNEISWLSENNRCLVFADVCPTVDLYDCVESDLRYAMKRMLDAAYASGYRRIGFIGSRESQNSHLYPYGERRCAAFVEWMKEKGLFDPALCLVDRLCFESGYELTQALLANERLPELLITANDNMAIGAYRAIREKGLSIPGHIGVASFNDIPAAQFLAPPLSTVKIFAERVGEVAVDLLLERIAGRDFVKKVTLTTDMIWRESCRNPLGTGLPAPRRLAASAS